MASACPDRDRLIVQSREPFNAEPCPADLIAAFRTPSSLFYVRSHGEVPPLGDDHAIVVDGTAGGPRTWTRDGLALAFETRTVEATLQCAGNRRSDLQAVARTRGDPWGVGAIGNARWTGVALVDLLRDAGLEESATGFVRFTAADTADVSGESSPYGVSIPLEKARDRDVLVAWAMNDELLAPEHGAPLRLVVPGYAGVRSIKWLTHIEVADAPSAAPIQARDYKLFPAAVRSSEEANWDAGVTINELPVNSAICVPASGDVVPKGATTLRGYAMAYGRRVARVEVSTDGGATWSQAAITDDKGGRWCWVRWSLETVLGSGEHRLVVRAVDDAGQGQPASADQVWNFAGYLATYWHEIVVNAV